jgi:ribosomal protein L35AE/L33A
LLLGSGELAASSRNAEVLAKDWPVEPIIQPLEVPMALAPLPVWVTDAVIQKESEPNDIAPRATPLAMNAVMAGCLDSVMDTDSYTFQVKQGQFYRLELHARDLLLPLDGYLTLYDGDKILAENDDADGLDSDPVLSWKATLDGTVRVVVSSLLTPSGPGAQYILCLKPGEEPLEAQITTGSVALAAGKTAEIKGKLIAQHGYSGKIRAQLQNLPFGLSADAVEVKSENGAEFTLTLRAAKNVRDWSGPIQLALWAEDKDGLSITVLGHHLPRGEAQRGRTTLDKIEHIWVTLSAQK